MSIKNKYLYIVAIIALLTTVGITGWKYFARGDLPAKSATNNSKSTQGNSPQRISIAAPNKSENGIPILMYHKVSPHPKSGGLGLRVTPPDFEWEMQYLKKNGYHTVNLGNVVDHYQKGMKLPAKPIVITFDDGYQDNYLYALPILKKYGFTATVFIVTNTIGGFNKYDHIKHIEPKNKMMNWTQIRNMNREGITIGAHTADHVFLTRIPLSEAKRQIAESKKTLENGLGKKVEYFCYPHGDVNTAVANLVKQSGYKAATATSPGLVTSRMNPYMLNRIRITGHFNHHRFIIELTKYNKVHSAKADINDN